MSCLAFPESSSLPPNDVGNRLDRAVAAVATPMTGMEIRFLGIWLPLASSSSSAVSPPLGTKRGES